MIKLDTKTLWLGAIIEFVPQDILMMLVNRFDKEATEPSIALLSSLMDSYDIEFAKPLAELALEYCDTDYAKKKIGKVARKLNKGSGTAANTGATAFQWFETVSKSVIDLGSEAAQLGNIFSGFDTKALDIQASQWKYQIEKEKSTRILIIGAFVIIAVIICIALLVNINKH